ncbi:MAG: hypothetical protein JXR76_04485 [Deltaproteobacteria bacterium]|nr:hypothetical protein [Deltaproteobacteria bacterium]
MTGRQKRITGCLGMLIAFLLTSMVTGTPVAKNVGGLKIRFSHSAHQTQPCESCHPGDDKGNLENISMRQCFGCHQKAKRKIDTCRTCHLVHPDGRMKTHLGERVLIPPAWLKGPTHGIDWAGNHATVAGSDSKFCANCHRETECSSCHTGRMRPKKIHPADWVNTHGNQSSIDNPRCTGCHRQQQFCLSCHRRTGVAPDAPTSRRQSKPSKYHGNASPKKICRRARSNISACASCHSESSCTTCHSVINPHPVGFSRRCKPLVKKNKRACAKCHHDDVEKRCR